MGYFRRLLLVNSAGYPFADVRLDGHCDMAGGQGVGKTTLMNAILYPFVVEDHLLDIDKYEKTRFSLYYFPETTNSFVIYEAVNNLDVPYCVFIHRNGQALSFHFINAPFDMDWLYDGDEQVKDWQAVRSKLMQAGITFKPVNTMTEFNDIILGKGKSYSEQYSLVKSPKDKDAIRPLLSAIFKNRPFNQETLKESLVAAILSANQIDSEVIDLSSHRQSLDGFILRYNDIKKMTLKGKNGKSAVEELAEEIFRHTDALAESKDRKNQLPRLLKYAIPKSSSDLEKLSQELQDLGKKRSQRKGQWELLEGRFDADIEKVTGEKAVAKAALDELPEIKAKYRNTESSLESLAQWVLDRESHRKAFEAAQKRYDNLTDNSKETRQKMAEAKERNALIYQNKEVVLKRTNVAELGSLNKEKEDLGKKVEIDRQRVEAEYTAALAAGSETTELDLLNELVNFSILLANCETIEAARAAVDGKTYSDELSAILSEVLKGRNGDGSTDLAVLKQRVEEARKRVEDNLDRKATLEKQKNEKLALIQSDYESGLADINKRISAANQTLSAGLKNNVEEFNAEAESIRKEYEAKIHGNDPVLKSAIEELNAIIADEEFIKQQIELYPTAAEDKKKLDGEASLKQRFEKLNIDLTNLRDQKKKAKTEYEEEDGTLSGKILTKKSEEKALSGALEEALRFLDNHSDINAVYIDADPLESETQLKDIITEYYSLNDRIRKAEEDIRTSVPKLYAPGMLSRIDTFQLGIGVNSSINTLDDFKAIADKLRVRLENSEENMGVDKFIKANTDVWLDEIRNISTVMGPIESMLMQIQKLCRKATEFMKTHNTTDCIDSFKMEVNEKDSTDLVRLLRRTAQFYNENYTILGFDNLFSSEDEPANKEATSLLEKIAVELEGTRDDSISITDMFDIRMDVTEKGTPHTDILSFNNIGSKGTANVLKAMLNMTLLHIILGKGQASNSRLICAIDEMNTIEASNLDALKEFAEAAGMFLFGSGQHHTQSALDYSYNVWDERDENGNITKWIRMDAASVKFDEQ